MNFSNKPPSPEDKKFTELIAILKDFIACTNAIQSKDESPYLDNADLKSRMHVSDSSLYRMRKKGIVPYIKILGKIYYRKSFFTETFRS